MSKSIKFKDNTYLDSTGVTHSRGLLSTIINNLLGRTYIQEWNSNNNGTYIKYSNGLMICYGTKTYTVQSWSTWGYSWESGYFSLGDFPVAFIETPKVVAIPSQGAYACWIERLQCSATSLGSTWVVRPVQTGSGSNVAIDYIAIGKWK